MTPTDEIRRLLDERGVEWTSGDTKVSRNICTDFRPDVGVTISVWESGDGKLGIDAHTDYRFTPEQAVEATLGRPYESPVAMHWDGDVLVLTTPRDPSCIHVQRSAEQPCKVYADESKVIAATLGPLTERAAKDSERDSDGRGECHNTSYRLDESRFHCSECGFGCWVKDVADGRDKVPRHCPNCGRRIKED